MMIPQKILDKKEEIKESPGADKKEGKEAGAKTKEGRVIINHPQGETIRNNTRDQGHGKSTEKVRTEESREIDKEIERGTEREIGRIGTKSDHLD